MTLTECYAIVERRAKGRCERCGIAISTRRPVWHPQRAHLNHIVSRSQLGPDHPDNLELICQACHFPNGQHAKTKARMEALRKTETPWP